MSSPRRWLRQAHVIAAGSELAVKRGCVFVDHVGDRIVAAGHNHVPSAIRDILATELSATHMAIALAARAGTPIRGTFLYTTEPSCTAVEAKILVTCGVKGIIRHSVQPDVSGVDEMLEEAGIATEYYDKPIGDFGVSKC